jgi:hypothetical protein
MIKATKKYDYGKIGYRKCVEKYAESKWKPL